MCYKILRTFAQKSNSQSFIYFIYTRAEHKDFIMTQIKSRAVDEINRNHAASGSGYESTNLNIERGAVAATFGAITKNILDAVLMGIGLDLNVSDGYAQIITNPNNAIDVRGRKYYPHTGIGNLKPFNGDGNSSSGCFSFYSMG